MSIMDRKLWGLPGVWDQTNFVEQLEGSLQPLLVEEMFY